MEELIKRIVSNLGIDQGLAEKAVGIILGFLKTEGPADKIGGLMAAFPGADDLISKAGAESGADGGESSGGGMLGGLGGLGGGIGGAIAGALGGSGDGGLMGTLSKLQGAGLDLGQAQGIGKEVLGFAKEKVGEDTVKEIAGSIPGLDQLL